MKKTVQYIGLGVHKETTALFIVTPAVGGEIDSFSKEL